MADFIGAIDQGTTSTRFLVFDRAGKLLKDLVRAGGYAARRHADPNTAPVGR